MLSMDSNYSVYLFMTNFGSLMERKLAFIVAPKSVTHLGLVQANPAVLAFGALNITDMELIV